MSEKKNIQDWFNWMEKTDLEKTYWVEQAIRYNPQRSLHDIIREGHQKIRAEGLRPAFLEFFSPGVRLRCRPTRRQDFLDDPEHIQLGLTVENPQVVSNELAEKLISYVLYGDDSRDPSISLSLYGKEVDPSILPLSSHLDIRPNDYDIDEKRIKNYLRLFTSIYLAEDASEDEIDKLCKEGWESTSDFREFVLKFLDLIGIKECNLSDPRVCKDYGYYRMVQSSEYSTLSLTPSSIISAVNLLRGELEENFRLYFHTMFRKTAPTVAPNAFLAIEGNEKYWWSLLASHSSIDESLQEEEIEGLRDFLNFFPNLVFDKIVYDRNYEIAVRRLWTPSPNSLEGRALTEAYGKYLW